MKKVLLLLCILGIAQAYAQDGTTYIDNVEYKIMYGIDGAVITGNSLDSQTSPISKLVLQDTVLIKNNEDGVTAAYPVVETGGFYYPKAGVIQMPFFLTVIDSLYFPNTLRKIGIQACQYSTFKYVYIPPTCNYIDNYAFANCSIESIALPKSLHTLGRNVFRDTKLGMERFELPEDVTINYEAFRNTSVKHFVIHNATVDDYAFADNGNLKTVTFDNTTRLELDGDWIFANCTALASIELPSGCKAIGKNIFEGCSSLERVVIPETVESIGENAFAGCTGLKKITVKAEIPPTLADMNVFPDYRTTTLIVPKDCRKYYEKTPIWMYFINVVEEGEPTENVYYKVSFVQPEGSSSILVPEGKRLTLQFTPNTDYRIHSVTYDGTDITSQLEPDNTFVTSSIYGDVEVSVAYETDADGVASAAYSPVKVRSEGRRIVVSHCRPGESVSLYLADGSVAAVSKADESGNAGFTTSESGLYIVRTSEKSIKLRTGL